MAASPNKPLPTPAGLAQAIAGTAVGLARMPMDDRARVRAELITMIMQLSPTEDIEREARAFMEAVTASKTIFGKDN